MPESDSQNMITNLLADNHHPGGTGPPEACELRLVQVALSSLNTLNNAIKGNLAGRSPLAGGLLHSFAETAEATAKRFRINRQRSSGRERTLCQHPSLTGGCHASLYGSKKIVFAVLLARPAPGGLNLLLRPRVTLSMK